MNKENIKQKTEDLNVNRGVITRIITPNENNPFVIEINLSMYVVPNNDFEKEEYEEQVTRITRFSKKTLKSYVSSNRDLFDGNSILDINFTSANLRKGYNKSVQMSLFVKHRGIENKRTLRNEVKNTIKNTVNSITRNIREEGFSCYKRRKSSNKE